MRLSQFTIFVPLSSSNGKYLVYNTFNQATAVISQRAKDVLSKLRNPMQGDEKKYIDMFGDLGLVVDDSRDEIGELRDWYNKARYTKSAMRATILTTYECNFACEYCVEEGVKASLRMDEEHSRSTVNWLIDRMAEYESDIIQLLFYGGEPLMNVWPIDYIASEINEYSKENGISFDFTITTNGSLLKPDLVDRLVPLGLKSVKITLDGDREAHNSKRPFKSGRGSFDVIIENIVQVADKVRVRIGTNVDSSNVESVPRMLDYLKLVGLKDKIDLVSFSPIVRIQVEEGTSILARKIDCGPSSEEWMMDNLTRLTWDAYMRGFKTRNSVQFTICSMNRDGTAVVIDPLGRVYTCPAFVGREGFQAGDIYHQELSDKHREFMSIEVPDECFKCAYMPVCSGGCKHVAYTRYGDLSKTVCVRDYLQKAIAETLKMQILSHKG